MISTGQRKSAHKLIVSLVSIGLASGVLGQSKVDPENGIPVTDPVVIAKCGSCHARDERGNMQRISWERTTPEGWQEALRRMILTNGVSLTTQEARSIVNYLSASHGLAPEEARAVAHVAERRIRDETISNENAQKACTKCHAFARALSWRRSLEDWRQLAIQHETQHKIPVNQEVVEYLSKVAPLHTPEWMAWNTRTRASNLEGRWLLTAFVPGRGKYYGEMRVESTGKDEFNTTARLTSVQDGSSLTRTGRSVVYGGFAWRGRSKGSEPANSLPGDLTSETREALWIAPDQSMADGRWFWGEYQEFGFDVTLRRAASSETTVMIVEPWSLKAGSQANRVRLIGDQIHGRVRPSDLNFGPGTTVRRVISQSGNEIVAEVDVASGAPLGKRDINLGRSVMPGAIAIYDRVDYIKVSPDSAMAAFGDRTHGRGFQQFEAIGYQRGADGQPRTADDVELGPVDVTWSVERFYVAEGSSSDQVGKVNPIGLFIPADANPNINFDVWAIATAKNEKDKNGKPLVGKAYLVVTVPTYTFNGRRFVRDLDRWVDDGPAQ